MFERTQGDRLVYKAFMFNLSDKVAIITGAAGGIGQVITQKLAEAQAAVVVSDLDQEKCEQVASSVATTGADALALACDVSKKQDLEDLVQETVNQFGKLDIMVNNAGIWHFTPFLETTEQILDKTLSVDLKGVFFGCQAAARQMVKQGKGGGSIINITSVAALEGQSNLSAYAAAKGGVSSLTRQIANELASYKIRVNAIAPGAINTTIKNGLSLPELLQKLLEEKMVVPLGKPGEPADVAHAVVFLASDEAHYITGHTLVVDGGWTLG